MVVVGRDTSSGVVMDGTLAGVVYNPEKGCVELAEFIHLGSRAVVDGQEKPTSTLQFGEGKKFRLGAVIESYTER